MRSVCHSSRLAKTPRRLCLDGSRTGRPLGDADRSARAWPRSHPGANSGPTGMRSVAGFFRMFRTCAVEKSPKRWTNVGALHRRRRKNSERAALGREHMLHEGDVVGQVVSDRCPKLSACDSGKDQILTPYLRRVSASMPASKPARTTHSLTGSASGRVRSRCISSLLSPVGPRKSNRCARIRSGGTSPRVETVRCRTGIL